MKFVNIFIYVLLFCLIANTSYADVRGFVKLNYLTYNSPFDTEANNEIFQINRISTNNPIAKKINFEFSYELVQIYSNNDSPELIKNYKTGTRSYRVDDFNLMLSSDEPYYFVNHNVDRLFATYESDNVIVSVGRQPISFGSGRTVNPTDVFTPFSYTVIDTEERNGVDAIRYRLELGDLIQIDMGALIGEDSKEENSAAYAMIHFAKGNFEYQPMLAYFKKATLLGLDITTSIKGASVWFEGAYVIPESVKPGNKENYSRYVVGGDYQLNSETILFSEYHYNGAGMKNAEDYIKLLGSFAYTNGSVFLAGKNNFDIGGYYALNPLQVVALSLKKNLDDGSSFAALTWEWNALENVYFNLGSFIGLGRASDSLLNIKSEFAATSNTVFTRLRYYF